MQQKIVQIGNSAGLLLPQSIRREIGLKPGSIVNIEKRGNKIIVSPTSKKLAKGVNPKFMRMVDEFIREHADVLKELAKH